MVLDIDEAKKIGAKALFDEKYKDKVRVVCMGDFSKEFCGGCHAKNTSEIGLFKIISETGVASGVRRIEAVTGEEFLNLFDETNSLVQNLSTLLKTNQGDLFAKVNSLIEEQKALVKENSSLKSSSIKNLADDIVKTKKEVNGINLITAVLNDMSADDLRKMGDNLRDKLGSGLVVLASINDDKVNFVCMATKDVTSKGVHAGNIIREVAKVAGGGGGGKPDSAQAGGKDVTKANEAVLVAEKLLQSI